MPGASETPGIFNLRSLVGRTGRATRLQLALDGWWEDAWVLKSGGEAPEPDDLRRWLGRSADTAFELFFEDVGFGSVFLGVRPNDLDAQEKARAIGNVHAELGHAEETNMLEMVDVLRSEIADGLFVGPCHFVEIGVVDAWKSIGPAQEVWRKGEPTPSPKALGDRLERRPSLLRSHTLPVAAEVGFDSPCPHWLGVPVSDGTADGEHVLNPDKLSDLVRIISQGSASQKESAPKRDRSTGKKRFV